MIDSQQAEVKLGEFDMSVKVCLDYVCRKRSVPGYFLFDNLSCSFPAKLLEDLAGGWRYSVWTGLGLLWREHHSRKK